MKENDQEVSVWSFLFVSLMYMILFVFFFSIFFTSTYDLVEAIQQNKVIIYFNKGAMYGLGGGISLFVFFIMTVKADVFKRPFSEKVEAFLVKTLLVGMAIMFVLPHVAYFVVSDMVDDMHYLECDVPTNAWPVYKTHVYTDAEQTCWRLIEEKKNR